MTLKNENNIFLVDARFNRMNVKIHKDIQMAMVEVLNQVFSPAQPAYNHSFLFAPQQNMPEAMEGCCWGGAV